MPATVWDADSNYAWRFAGAGFGLSSAAFLYAAYRDSARRKYILSTPWAGLADLEKIKPSDSPVYVKLEGRVGTDFPITAEISKEQGAIYEKISEGVWYSLRFRESRADRFQKDKLRRVSPFYLRVSDPAKPKGGEVKVSVTPFSEHEPKLEQVHKHEEPAGNFMLSLLLGSFYIPYPYKVIVTESTLPLNRNLLAAGVVTRLRDGRLQLSSPDAGFFVPDRHGLLTLQEEHAWAKQSENRQAVKTAVGALLGVFGGICFFVAGGSS